MIDLHLLRKEPDKIEIIKDKILQKEPSFDIDSLIELDAQVRKITAVIEDLRKQRNELAQKGKQGVTEKLKTESIEVSKKIKAFEKVYDETREKFNVLALSCPNIIQDDIPLGTKENNQVIKSVGKKCEFSFNSKNHIELNEKNNWFDINSAFALYRPNGAKVLYALTQLMIKNNVKYGYEPIIPPYLVNEEALVNSGNLPKFRGDFYEIPDDKLCLIPTAEVSLTNIHANQILNDTDLPKKYTAWTSCFRREAGGYGAGERGLIRIHQFEKVELYTICKPENSDQELDKMLACAQDLLQQLGLCYQVSLLAAQDCSFSSSKTYDIEVWLPGQEKFYEVSSCSNCTDFQARRAKIRYKIVSGNGKPILAHTLNGSSLALPRLMVALMEQYQTEDGSINLPPVLKEVMNTLW